MDVELIFKIAAVGIIVAVLTQLLIRSGREEQAMLTSLAGLIVVLTLIITQISTLFNTIKQLFGFEYSVNFRACRCDRNNLRNAQTQKCGNLRNARYKLFRYYFNRRAYSGFGYRYNNQSNHSVIGNKH